MADMEDEDTKEATGRPPERDKNERRKGVGGGVDKRDF